MAMERLNLRIPKPYGESTKEEIPFKKHFFIVSEGQTEETYFHGVNNFRKELKIKDSITIEVIEKEVGDEGKSHPRQLIDAALYNMGRITKDFKNIEAVKWKENCKWDFNPEDDIVCIIFDKDYKDLEKEINYIYDKSKENGIYLGFSNPNFEFWLLLHCENVLQYDNELLLKNPKNLQKKIVPGKSANKKYLEILLSMNKRGYKKGTSLRFEKFKEGIPLAIEQEKLYQEDNYKLFDELGSSVGLLLEMMINK